MTQPGPPPQVPITNGFVRSFGHVRMNIAGLDFTGGFVKVKRSRKRTRDKARSNSPDPVGKTLGDNDYEASVEMFFDWFMYVLLTLQNVAPGYGDQPFTLYTSYVGKGLVPYTDTILNCTFDTTDADDSAGTKPLTRTVELNPTKILFGGIDDLEDPLINYTGQ